jgi:hypothetical protein
MNQSAYLGRALSSRLVGFSLEGILPTDEGGCMPFKSEAQRRYFEANQAKLEKQGVDVKEWEESSRGLKLPERVPRRPTTSAL